MEDINFIITFYYSIVGVMPLLMLIGFYKLFQPKYYGIPLFALFFILVGTGVLGMSSDFLDIVTPNIVDGNPDNTYLNDIKAKIEMWGFVFPAVTLAIGVNLFTEFLNREKPNA